MSEFEAICRTAIENETPDNLAALGAWFERNGKLCFEENSEEYYYDASLPGEPIGTRPVWPVYGPEEDGYFPIVGYSFSGPNCPYD